MYEPLAAASSSAVMPLARKPSSSALRAVMAVSMLAGLTVMLACQAPAPELALNEE
ncbi:hypothetical protein D3C85_1875730 [compost metagenome]